LAERTDTCLHQTAKEGGNSRRSWGDEDKRGKEVSKRKRKRKRKGKRKEEAGRKKQEEK